MNRLPKPIVIAGFMTMMFLYLPVIILIGLSFNASTMGVAWQGFSFQWYEKLLSDPSIVEATVNSLIIAVISTVFSLMLGLGAAIGLEKWRGTPALWMNVLVMLPLVIPEILLGVALLMVFVLFQIPLGFGSIIIGHMVFNLPLTIVILRARLRRFGSGLGRCCPRFRSHVMGCTHAHHSPHAASRDFRRRPSQLYGIAG